MAGLPARSPLKAAMMGSELLLDRAQLWEQSAARHVSIAPQLEKVAAVARRWRRLELASWRTLLTRSIAQHAAGRRQHDTRGSIKMARVYPGNLGVDSSVRMSHKLLLFLIGLL